MKSSDEIRAVAWDALWTEGWIWRILALWAVIYAISAGIGYLVSICQWAMGAEDWTDYASQRVVESVFNRFSSSGGNPEIWQELRQTLKLDEIPDVRSPWICASLTFSSIFRILVTAAVSGFSAVATAYIWLRAAGMAGGEWLGEGLAYGKRPLGLAMLYILEKSIVIGLSLFFWLPGYYASFCFQCAYYLKVDHPDWGAVRCLRESARMMEGHKWRAFWLDWSYWAIVTWAMVPLLGVSILLFPLLHAGIVWKIASVLLIIPLLAISVTVAWLANHYIGIGQAVLYREILARETDF